MLRLWKRNLLTGEPLKPLPNGRCGMKRGEPGEFLHMDVRKLRSSRFVVGVGFLFMGEALVGSPRMLNC